MSNIFISIRDWPYQYYINQPVKCAWSECDFFAYSIGNTVAILGNDNGEYSPLYMWAPFESDVSCIEWMNCSLSTAINHPILAIASNNGRLLFFNVKNASPITSLNFKNEKVQCLRFSPTKSNQLFIGFESGILIHAKLSLDKNQHYEMLQNFTFKHSIDFITFDLIFESIIAVASSNGSFSIIKGDKVIDNYNLEEKINSFEFYPEMNNFIVISTPSRTVLFSIEEMTIINFLAQPNVLNLYIISDQVILVERDRLSIYRSIEKVGWKQISEVAVSSLRVECTSFVNNKLMMISSPLQLSVIEVVRGKLFVTKSCSLLNSRPVDWSFYKGSIAISTANGHLHITAPVPESVPSSKSPKKKTTKEDGETAENESDPVLYKIGSSCNFIHSYEISSCPMRVKWLSPSLLIMWSQSNRRIVTVDLSRKTVKDLVPFNFLKDKFTVISQVIVSPNKEFLCVVINKQSVILIRCPELAVVSIIALKEIAIGAFSADSSSFFFASNTSVLYIYDTLGKLAASIPFTFEFNPITVDITAITFAESGHLYIGDAAGSVYKFKKGFHTVKRIFQNSTDPAVITDQTAQQPPASGSYPNEDGPLFDITNLFGFGLKGPSSPPSNSMGAAAATINQLNQSGATSGAAPSKSASKSLAIGSITLCGKLLLIVDRSGRGFFFAEEASANTKLVSLPFAIDNYQYSSDASILVKLSKHKRLSLFSLKGKYTKRRAPAWYRIPMLNDDIREKAKMESPEDFLALGVTLPKTIAMYNRKPANESMEILINVLLNATKLNDTLYPIALSTGNFEICRKILRKTSPKAQNFLWNMTTLALFDLKKPGHAMKESIDILKEAGNIGSCYEMLMVTKASKMLLNLMLEKNDLKGAFNYLRSQSPEINKLENCEEEINRLANALFDLKKPIAPVIIMAQLGMFNEICVYITKLPFDNAMKKAMIHFIHKNFIEVEVASEV